MKIHQLMEIEIKLSISVKSEIVEGVGANTSVINFSNNHMGTHMDTPFHFCMDGKKTLRL